MLASDSFSALQRICHQLYASVMANGHDDRLFRNKQTCHVLTHPAYAVAQMLTSPIQPKKLVSQVVLTGVPPSWHEQPTIIECVLVSRQYTMIDCR